MTNLCVIYLKLASKTENAFKCIGYSKLNINDFSWDKSGWFYKLILGGQRNTHLHV